MILFCELEVGDRFLLRNGPKFVMEKKGISNYFPVPLGPEGFIDPQLEVIKYVERTP